MESCGANSRARPFGVAELVSFGLKASRNWPVPSTTATFFSPSPLAIIKPGRTIKPAIRTGKKRVMKMNIFLRTATMYSRLRTAHIFFMQPEGSSLEPHGTTLLGGEHLDGRCGEPDIRAARPRPRFRCLVRRALSSACRNRHRSFSYRGRRGQDAGTRGIPRPLSEGRKGPRCPVVARRRDLQCLQTVSAKAVT